MYLSICIFGPLLIYCIKVIITKKHMHCWISKLKDSTLVSNLTIPGTHDSAAYKTVARGKMAFFHTVGEFFAGTPFIKCQTMD